jgi:hypothetical protein
MWDNLQFYDGNISSAVGSVVSVRYGGLGGT